MTTRSIITTKCLRIIVFWMTFTHFVQKFGQFFLVISYLIQVYRVRFTKAFIHIVIRSCILLYLY